MERRTAVVAVAVAVVVGATVVVPRVGGSDGEDDQAGTLRAGEVEKAEVSFDTATLRGGLRYQVLAVGDVLVSTSAPEGTDPSIYALPSQVVFSTDLGATWAGTELPGLPPIEDENLLRDLTFHPVDGAVVVEMASAPPDPDEPTQLYLWVSTDGIEWRGGELSTLDLRTWYVEVTDIWRDEDGRLYVTVTDGEDDDDRDDDREDDREDDDEELRTFVVRSDDDGRTWEEADCPSPGPPVQQAEGCPVPYAGGLLVSPQNRFVSLDGGRTWEELDLPGIDLDAVEGLDVVQRSDGGWLALASEHQGDAEYGGLHRYLLRSEDGIRWERVFDHDTRCVESISGEWISTPVPLGRRWLVAYSCHSPIDAPTDVQTDYKPEYLSQLLVVSADGSSIRPIAGTVESRYLYTQPTTKGDTVVVPLQRHGIPFTNVRTVAPP